MGQPLGWLVALNRSDDPDDFSFWVDTFAKGDPEEIRELVIAGVLTPQMLDESRVRFSRSP